ncbi:hypothetical protein BZL30_3678 [Mycobacterium kansasii]|uniref:Uncharacterized protein n=1 Tax=Mycobacterium kansasii TaxID=1768 RepID=A0A1V3XA83_MYCKA|nr:hypothetical protein BZL30_3678 [Mycobacterium kansasii]
MSPPVRSTGSPLPRVDRSRSICASDGSRCCAAVAQAGRPACGGACRPPGSFEVRDRKWGAVMSIPNQPRDPSSGPPWANSRMATDHRRIPMFLPSGAIRVSRSPPTRLTPTPVSPATTRRGTRTRLMGTMPPAACLCPTSLL